MRGKCHLCGEEKDIRYCKLCVHWFCDDCRRKYWERGYAAVMEMVGGRRPNCCGPLNAASS